MEIAIIESSHSLSAIESSRLEISSPSIGNRILTMEISLPSIGNRILTTETPSPSIGNRILTMEISPPSIGNRILTGHESRRNIAIYRQRILIYPAILTTEISRSSIGNRILYDETPSSSISNRISRRKYHATMAQNPHDGNVTSSIATKSSRRNTRPSIGNRILTMEISPHLSATESHDETTIVIYHKRESSREISPPSIGNRTHVGNTPTAIYIRTESSRRKYHRIYIGNRIATAETIAIYATKILTMETSIGNRISRRKYQAINPAQNLRRKQANLWQQNPHDGNITAIYRTRILTTEISPPSMQQNPYHQTIESSRGKSPHLSANRILTTEYITAIYRNRIPRRKYTRIISATNPHVGNTAIYRQQNPHDGNSRHIATHRQSSRHLSATESSRRKYHRHLSHRILTMETPSPSIGNKILTTEISPPSIATSGHRTESSRRKYHRHLSQQNPHDEISRHLSATESSRRKHTAIYRQQNPHDGNITAIYRQQNPHDGNTIAIYRQQNPRNTPIYRQQNPHENITAIYRQINPHDETPRHLSATKSTRRNTFATTESSRWNITAIYRNKIHARNTFHLSAQNPHDGNHRIYRQKIATETPSPSIGNRILTMETSPPSIGNKYLSHLSQQNPHDGNHRHSSRRKHHRHLSATKSSRRKHHCHLSATKSQDITPPLLQQNPHHDGNITPSIGTYPHVGKSSPSIGNKILTT
ncbi:hypothetical protein C7M84_010126 [Penaeus vannamei]|uniref:Uncharacterized protein n=1 Tax=Penaeus vannamei TaxID=6689 RepID=A0A423T5Q9_PENVA|nr:hypothetical protein C7M84_010126 [Penaeus vannamei]